MTNKEILLIENTELLANSYISSLVYNGYQVKHVDTASKAIETIRLNKNFNIIILDMNIPDMDCLDLTSRIKQEIPDASILILARHDKVNKAVEAMGKGATDFLIKPFSTDKLVRVIGCFQTYQRAINDMVSIPTSYDSSKDKRSNSSSIEYSGFIGTSNIMQDMYNIIEKSAKSSATVFITGESGTGKELCAKAVHNLSNRKAKPFIAINCAAIPKELMESEIFGHKKGAFTGALSDREGAASLANGGSLFLDEICEMPMELQSKMLRFVQECCFKKVGGNKLEAVDIRIICATNKNPLEEVKKGNFREDLYYRLHVIPIDMPPLRKRGDDIIDLAYTMLLKYSDEEKRRFSAFSEEVEEIFLQYSWPGNIRELQNTIRKIVVLNNTDIVTLSMLPEYILSDIKVNGKNNYNQNGNFFIKEAVNRNIKINDSLDPLWEIEKNAIERTIEECGGNVPKAAAILEISPSTIYRKRLQWEKKICNQSQR